MLRLHPYGSLYINALQGGLPGINGRFEADYWGRSYKEAAEWLGKTLKLFPDTPLARMQMNRAEDALGLKPEVFGWFPDQEDAPLRSAYEKGGFREFLKQAIAMRIAETDRPCTERPDLAAMTYAILKESEQMYACLEVAVQKRGGPTAIVIAPDQAFAPYRAEPRFIAILKQLGLEE